MAGILEYLDWRGDVPLDVDPFGEVDNLVLAELSYTDFGGIVSEQGQEVALTEACRMYFERHTHEEIMADKSFTARSPLLLEPMCGGARFQDTRLKWYVNEVHPDQDEQMAAITFLLPNGGIYIAFRGTDNTLVGWKEDFNFSYLSETPGQRRAVAYLNAVGRQTSGPLLVGGHSKGGNLAVYAAAFCDEMVQARIRTVYTNDGPGFRQDILDTEGYARILPRVISLIPDTDIIGQLLSNRCACRVVKSEARGIWQHDGFTWSVRRNRLVGADQSDLSLLAGKALGGWLEQMNDETRRSFTATVFAMFESAGLDTVDGMLTHKWKSLEAMLAALRGVPRDKLQEALRIMRALGESGRQVTAQYLTARIARIKETGRPALPGLQDGDTAGLPDR